MLKVLKPILMKTEKTKPLDTAPIIRAYTKITLQEAIRLATTGIRISK